ncbi:MAG: hypothetical protein QG599_2660 [Pseudomonadota bacterium]|nr:hypothetical protein [Pseudomonadota bacterium]
MVTSSTPLSAQDDAEKTVILLPARLPRRLAAIVYDSLLLAGVLVVATGLATGVTTLALGVTTVNTDHPLQGNPFFQIYLLLICFLFYGGFWTRGGQTLGMRAWRLRLQQRGGGTIHWRQALLRFLSGGLWLIPMIAIHQIVKPGVGWSLGIGLAAWWLLLALRLPDRWSATELVVLPKAAHQRNRRNA